ncbi:MAG: hypothetical protein CM15mP77_4160 [Synechococcus sp.]|nr:MAG: hypothetical protein CM15mP77_4160 [Synechococcus sp.]
MLEDDGDKVDLVHSQDPEAAARLDGFQAGDADWLVSIDMCAEGFDAPRLRVVAYLTTVVTRSRFVQGITRAVRMTPELAEQEPVPRNPSYVVAPADPLLMSYARTWSVAEPYVLSPADSGASPLSDSPGAWTRSQPAAGGGQGRSRRHDSAENAATARFSAALTTSFCVEKCEFLRIKPRTGTLILHSDLHREAVMDAAMERRIVVATGWASTRIAVLDKEERYEDSYAITQEFCEWITCIGENDEMLEANVLAVPRNPSKRRSDSRQPVQRLTA